MDHRQDFLAMKHLCMICGEEKDDAPTGGEWDEYGVYWTYCRDCDCWTEHPE